MEARWVLKVARMAGDWKEPLYTWYPLVCDTQKGEALMMLSLSVSSTLAQVNGDDSSLLTGIAHLTKSTQFLALAYCRSESQKS
jgi:hypothetical protein